MERIKISCCFLNIKLIRSVLQKLTITTLMVIFCFLTGCVTNPVTGGRELRLVSESKEIEVGNEQYRPGQQLQGGVYILDENLTEYIDTVGQRLANVSDRNLPYEFKILNNSTPNAWALPGGKIAINRGLLTELHSEAELAAVLSHEIVHAAARHGAKNMERGLFLKAAVLATAIIAKDEDYTLLVVGGAQIASGLIAQKYSRSAEFEADYYGMRYMARAGYDPRGAVDLQEAFLNLNDYKKSDWLSGLFASHPPSYERWQINKQTAIELGVAGEIGDTVYQKKISYLMKTAPAYQNYDKARLALQGDDLVTAASLMDAALKIESNEALFYGLVGDIYFKKNQVDSAIQAYDKAIECNNQYFYFFEKRGLAYKRVGNQTKAKEDFLGSIYLLPTAISHNELGLIALNQGNRYEAKRHFLAASSSKTDVGKRALISYVKLDLPDNPGKYIRVHREDNEGENALFKVINRAPIPVRTIFLDANFEDGDGKYYYAPLEIQRVLYPTDQITIVIDPQVVPAEYHDSLEIVVVSAEIL